MWERRKSESARKNTNKPSSVEERTTHAELLVLPELLPEGAESSEKLGSGPFLLQSTQGEEEEEVSKRSDVERIVQETRAYPVGVAKVVPDDVLFGFDVEFLEPMRKKEERIRRDCGGIDEELDSLLSEDVRVGRREVFPVRLDLNSSHVNPKKPEEDKLETSRQ